MSSVNQTDLFEVADTSIPDHRARELGIGRVRRTDPGTSYAAAANVVRFAGTHCARILEALERGPATVDEIAARTGLASQQINKRLPELQRQGKAMPTGRERMSRACLPEREWALT